MSGLANNPIYRRGYQPFSMDGIDASRGRRPPTIHTPCFNQIPTKSAYLSTDMHKTIRENYKAFDILKQQPYKSTSGLQNGASHYIDKSLAENNVITRMCTNMNTPMAIEKHLKQQRGNGAQILDNTQVNEQHLPTKSKANIHKKMVITPQILGIGLPDNFNESANIDTGAVFRNTKNIKSRTTNIENASAGAGEENSGHVYKEDVRQNTRNASVVNRPEFIQDGNENGNVEFNVLERQAKKIDKNINIVDYNLNQVDPGMEIHCDKPVVQKRLPVPKPISNVINEESFAITSLKSNNNNNNNSKRNFQQTQTQPQHNNEIIEKTDHYIYAENPINSQKHNNNKRTNVNNYDGYNEGITDNVVVNNNNNATRDKIRPNKIKKDFNDNYQGFNDLIEEEPVIFNNTTTRARKNIQQEKHIIESNLDFDNYNVQGGQNRNTINTNRNRNYINTAASDTFEGNINFVDLSKHAKNNSWQNITEQPTSFDVNDDVVTNFQNKSYNNNNKKMKNPKQTIDTITPEDSNEINTNNNKFKSRRDFNNNTIKMPESFANEEDIVINNLDKKITNKIRRDQNPLMECDVVDPTMYPQLTKNVDVYNRIPSLNILRGQQNLANTFDTSEIGNTTYHLHSTPFKNSIKNGSRSKLVSTSSQIGEEGGVFIKNQYRFQQKRNCKVQEGAYIDNENVLEDIGGNSPRGFGLPIIGRNGRRNCLEFLFRISKPITSRP